MEGDSRCFTIISRRTICAKMPTDSAARRKCCSAGLRVGGGVTIPSCRRRWRPCAGGDEDALITATVEQHTIEATAAQRRFRALPGLADGGSEGAEKRGRRSIIFVPILWSDFRASPRRCRALCALLPSACTTRASCARVSSCSLLRRSEDYGVISSLQQGHLQPAEERAVLCVWFIISMIE